MQGLKAQLKQFLKSKGVKVVTLDNGATIKLQNAKTRDLFNAAVKLGF